jgi:hypothetical protein
MAMSLGRRSVAPAQFFAMAVIGDKRAKIIVLLPPQGVNMPKHDSRKFAEISYF